MKKTALDNGLRQFLCFLHFRSYVLKSIPDFTNPLLIKKPCTVGQGFHSSILPKR